MSESVQETSKDNQTQHSRIIVIINLLLMAGLALSVFLAWQGMSVDSGGGVAGCGPGSGCSEVLATKWAKWFDVPTGVLAAAVYFILLAVQFMHRRAPNHIARLILLAGSLVLIGAAVWFVVLQVAVLNQFCKYCMATHTVSLLTGGIVLFYYRSRLLLVAVPLAILALAALIGGQVTADEETGPEIFVGGGGFDTGPVDPSVDPAAKRRLGVLEGTVHLNVDEYPLIGQADARRAVVLLFDYTCAHCRNLHELLREFIDQNPDELVIVALPIALDYQCNPTLPEGYVEHDAACVHARMAVASFLAGQPYFEKYDRWVLQSDEPYDAELVRIYTQSMIGSQKFEEIMASGEVDSTLDRYSQVYELAGFGSVPKLLAPRGKFTGEPDDRDQFFTWMRYVVGVGDAPPTTPDDPLE